MPACKREFDITAKTIFGKRLEILLAKKSRHQLSLATGY